MSLMKIFLPKRLIDNIKAKPNESYELFGDLIDYQAEHRYALYVKHFENLKTDQFSSGLNGVYTLKPHEQQKKFSKTTTISISYDSTTSKLTSIFSDDKNFDLKCLFIIYNNQSNQYLNEYILNKNANLYKKHVNSNINDTIEKSIKKLEDDKWTHVFVTKSEFISHFIKVILILKSVYNCEQNGIKRISKLSNLLLNWLLGFLLANYILTKVDFNTHEWLNDQMTVIFQNLIFWLTSILNWLMGVPAGLKLNKQLDEFLGRFFLYHMYLWNGSISLFQDLLPYVTWLIIYCGYIGITFQLALLIDTLNILTIHTNCFYVYASRMYKLNIDSLKSLFRLFTGKKLNPLRKRIDSYSYDTDQLFIGTLGFCIVFFLLPTILMYYAVFLSLRIVILILNYILKNLVNIFSSIPIYEILIYFLNSNNYKS